MDADRGAEAAGTPPHSNLDRVHLADGTLATDPELGSELGRAVALMARLRRDCPWDAKQTHRSLIKHLIEESGEVVDAVEDGDDTELTEELGDLLLQILFHSEIAREQHRFDIDDVARGSIDKLVSRHPWVFGNADAPSDMMNSWEAAKQVEKHRASALDGIPRSVAVLARARKVIARARDLRVGVELDDTAITETEVGEQILALVARAEACDIDPDQATRDALRRLEAQVVAAETGE